METAITSCSTRAANGMVIVSHATTPATTRNDAAATLVAIGGRPVAPPTPMRRLRWRGRIDHVRYPGGCGLVDRLGRCQPSIVLMKALAPVAAPRGDTGP